MSTLLLLLRLLPLVMDSVLAIERAIPLSGKGPEKLALVVDLVQQEVPDAKECVALITRMVSAAVRTLKAVGVFKSAEPTA